MTSDRLFDEGAALERTQMAWTRTGLALLATTALSARLLLDEPGWLVAVLALTGSVGAVGLLLVADRGYARVHSLLWACGDARPARVGVTAPIARTAAAAVAAVSLLLAVSVALQVVRT